MMYDQELGFCSSNDLKDLIGDGCLTGLVVIEQLTLQLARIVGRLVRPSCALRAQMHWNPSLEQLGLQRVWNEVFQDLFLTGSKM